MNEETNNIAQQNIKKTYNEPVTREIPVSEFISRLNPVDIKEYIQEEYDNENLSNFHVTHKNSYSQNNLPHKDLYSMKEIENILNVGNILEKANIQDHNEQEYAHEITKPYKGINKKNSEKISEEEKYREEKKEITKLQNKPIVPKRPKTGSTKGKEIKQEESESLFNMLNDKVDKKENKQKAGNVVNDFFNSILKSETKNQENLQKQIKENEKFISNNNKTLSKQLKDQNNQSTNIQPKNVPTTINKPQVKKGELIEFDFKNDKIDVTEKEKIKENFVKEREKMFNEFKKNKEEQEKEKETKDVLNDEKFSKEALFQKRKEMIKKREFKKK